MSTRTRTAVVAFALVVGLATLGGHPVAAASIEGRYAFAEAVTSGRYTNGQTVFDLAGSAQPGRVALTPTTSALLTQVANPVSASGPALRFGDAGCRVTAGSVRCAHLGRVAIASPSGFSPRQRNFAVEVTIRLTAAPRAGAAGGMNIVQLGSSSTPDEWKVQVDYGRPSCVIRNDNAAASFVERPTALTVGVSYRVRCARTGSQLGLTVTPLGPGGTGTAEAVRVAPRPAAGDLASFGATRTVSIGNKGTARNPDQLSNAIIDDVFYIFG